MLNVRTKAERIKFDGTRKMSGEDQMMFQDHKPFVDKDDSPKSTPASSPDKEIKEVLRPIEMPKPFKI